MQAFVAITGRMVYLPIVNIDTDMIIPKQYLKTIKRTGLGKYLFAEQNWDLQQASVLIAGDNFGCGSSREHAVWSLVDYGIRVIIAPSFADIFYSNSIKNGLLPIALPQDEIQKLVERIDDSVTINLEQQKIYCGTITIPFEIDPAKRFTLLKGLDEIGETLESEDQILQYETDQREMRPWIFIREADHE